jgi:Na+-translocating ferredoxin:NAD+ oxidoreductase subunit E
MGIGFFIALFSLGSVREILGAGTFLGVSLFGPHYQPWVLFLLPPGGFFTLAIWLLVFSAWNNRKKRQEPKTLAEAA